MSIHRYVGDYGQTIIFTFAVSLAGVTGIVIRVKKPDNAVVTWTVDPTDIDPVLQRAKYTLADRDLDVKGAYRLQGVLSWSGRRAKTAPVILEVGEGI